MSDPVKTIEEEALNLAEEDRAKLARVLLLSLDEADGQDHELAWAEEAEKRYQELKTGLVQPIPSEEVLQEARSLLM